MSSRSHPADIHHGEIRQIQHNSFVMRNQLADLAVQLIILTRYQSAVASHHDGDAGAVNFKRKPPGRRLVGHLKTPDETELSRSKSEPGDCRI
jgi:hypothetical protein